MSLLANMRRARLQRTLSALTAASALPLGAEIYFEHYRGSFGDRWMWTPILATPAVVAAGTAGVFSARAARTLLPAAAAVFAADGVVGMVTHLRGIMRRPGGLAEP